MTREEVKEQLKTDRDLCNFNPMTGEEEPMNEDCRKSAEALDIAIKVLEQEPNDDCVSRQAVLEVLKNNRYRFNISQEGYCEGKVLWSENLIKDDAYKEIEQLPSITPARKKGKWIYYIDEQGWSMTYPVKCSNCNTKFTWSKYCPNCGSFMGSKDGERRE